MSFLRVALSALVIAGTAGACRPSYDDRENPVAARKLLEGDTPASNLTALKPTRVTVAQAPPPAPSEPSPHVYSEPPLLPAPTPAPPPRAEPRRQPELATQTEPAPAPAPIVIVMPQTQTPQQQQQQQPMTTQPSAYPQVPPLYSPPAPATVSENGVINPAVPLYIDPGAEPGAPGNGAPST